MIQATVKMTPAHAGLGINSASLFRKVQMQKLGQFARDTIVARTRAGIGSDDGQMPILSQKKYAIYRKRADGTMQFVRAAQGYGPWKAAHGLQPYRDMWGTGKQQGHMLDNFTVRLVTEDMVRIAFTQRQARAKAISNERRTPFLSFSPKDEQKILEYARQLFKVQVEILRREIWVPSGQRFVAGSYMPTQLPGLGFWL